jgi:predicted PurR-regulated permease PerM
MAPATSQTEDILSYAVLVAVTVAFGAVIAGFWQPTFWAVVIGILFKPMMSRIDTAFSGRSSLAAATTVLLIFVFVLVPALLVASIIIDEAANLYSRIAKGDIDLGAIARGMERHVFPRLREWAPQIGIEIDQIAEKLRAAVTAAVNAALSLVLSAGQNAATLVMNFLLVLYLLFFVLPDGSKIVSKIRDAVLLPESQKQRFLTKFVDVSVATLKGTFSVGLVQGILGGLIFSLLGIGGAVFWGAVMGIVSIIPAFGTALVWVPAAVLLFANGAWIKAMILMAFGVFVISMVDNVLRPVIVSCASQMPDYLVLLSTMGGLSLMGISGFMVGPIVAALFSLLGRSMLSSVSSATEAGRR